MKNNFGYYYQPCIEVFNNDIMSIYVASNSSFDLVKNLKGYLKELKADQVNGLADNGELIQVLENIIAKLSAEKQLVTFDRYCSIVYNCERMIHNAEIDLEQTQE